jgi:hypothetical protein
MSDQRNSFSIGHYLVALIDILGQKEKLLELKDLPAFPEEHKRFIETLKDTYGVVETFRNAFDTFFQRFLSDSSKGFPLPAPLRQQFADLRVTSVKTQRFADTVIVYASLRTDAGNVPLNGVFAALLACSSTFLATLAGGFPCRGGIDIGLAAELHEGEIYGPALNSAYDLERRVAQYPRIVVGQGVIDYLNQYAKVQGDDTMAKYMRALAQRCLALLAKDDNGHPFLDVLGEGHKNVVGSDVLKDIIPEAYAFVVEQAKQAEKNDDRKLASRYALLRQYFEARR